MMRENLMGLDENPVSISIIANFPTLFLVQHFVFLFLEPIQIVMA